MGINILGLCEQGHAEAWNETYLVQSISKGFMFEKIIEIKLGFIGQ